MISSEVQRTLVKSPPELWAELGDPASLARHLGELGEIRITRAEPEKLVEWEAESAKGTVAMKGSGWGTKVTLTASRELAPPQPAPEEESPVHDQPSSTGDEDPTAEPVALDETSAPAEEPSPSGLETWSRQQADLAVTAAERFGHEHSATLLGTDLQRTGDLEIEAETGAEEPIANAEPLPAASPQEGAEPEPDSKEPTTEIPEPRRGLLARLFGFGRRRQSAPPTESEVPMSIEAATTQEGLADTIPTAADTDPEPAAASDPESPPVDSYEPAEATAPAELELPSGAGAEIAETQPAAEATPPADLTAELRAAEEEVEAILTGVLDRLGAAHHRPFSRS